MLTAIPANKRFHYTVLLAAGTLFLFAQSFAELSLPALMSNIINIGIIKERSVSYVLTVGGIMLLAGIAAMGLASGTAFCYSRIGSGIGACLRHFAMQKTLSFTAAEINHFTPSALLTRITTDTTNIQNFCANDLRNVFYAPAIGIGGIILSYQAAPSICWIIYLLLLILTVLVVSVFAVIYPFYKRSPGIIDKLNSIAGEILNGVMVIRAFNNEEFHTKRFRKTNAELARNILIIIRMPAIMVSMMMLVMNLFAIAVVYLGAEKITQNQLQIGNLLAFVQYMFLIISGFGMLTMCLISMPASLASAVRLKELFKTLPGVQDHTETKTLPLPVKGEVKFENVCFRYSNAAGDALHNISCTLLPGQTTAIIGAVGSGKTTLVQLLLRFYNPAGGRILLDGVDIADLKQHTLRENIGYVPQLSRLFSGTIEDNLRWALEYSSKDYLQSAICCQPSLFSAAEAAQAVPVIESRGDGDFNKGLQTPVSQGGNNFSGGQRQRLAIARTLAAKPPFYIFDDCFNALDNITERKLRESLAGYAKGSTVLMVAQRISTIQDASQIIVLHNGHIAGMGTHSQLLRDCKEYQDIAASQGELQQ